MPSSMVKALNQYSYLILQSLDIDHGKNGVFLL